MPAQASTIRAGDFIIPREFSARDYPWPGWAEYMADHVGVVHIAEGPQVSGSVTAVRAGGWTWPVECVERIDMDSLPSITAGDIVVPVHPFRGGDCGARWDSHLSAWIGQPVEVTGMAGKIVLCRLCSAGPNGQQYYWPAACLEPFDHYDRADDSLFEAYKLWWEKLEQDRLARRAKLRAEATDCLYYRIRKWAMNDPRSSAKQWRWGVQDRYQRTYNKERGDYVAAVIAAGRKYPDRQDVLCELVSLVGDGVGAAKTGDVKLLLQKQGSLLGVGNMPWDQRASPAFSLTMRLPEYMAHCVHVSETDPLKVAYYPSLPYMRAGRCVITSPGKYLTKYFSREALAKRKMDPELGLTELQIKALAEKYRVKFGPVEVKWARTPEECIRAINEGPTESCMSKGFQERDNWWHGDEHPATVYGSTPDCPTDTAVAYIEDENGRITARAIVNTAAKRVARGYGDWERLIKALKMQGYDQVVGALAGARIRAVPVKGYDDTYHMPYVDAGTGSGGGYMYATLSDDGKYFILGTGYGPIRTYCGYENKGTTWSVSRDDSDDDDSYTCDSCGCQTHDTVYVEYSDEYICSDCANDTDLYVVAYNGRRAELVPRDDAVECRDTGDFYTDRGVEYYIDKVGYCDYDEELYLRENLRDTDQGTYYVDRCAHLDIEHDGYEWARSTVVTTTMDGRVIHQDDTTTYVHGGNEYVLHDDDDPAEYIEGYDEDEEETATEDMSAVTEAPEVPQREPIYIYPTYA